MEQRRQEGVSEWSQPDGSLEGALTSSQNQNRNPLFSNFTSSQRISPQIRISPTYEECLGKKNIFLGYHRPHLLPNKDRTTLQSQQYFKQVKTTGLYTASHMESSAAMNIWLFCFPIQGAVRHTSWPLKKQSSPCEVAKDGTKTSPTPLYKVSPMVGHLRARCPDSVNTEARSLGV